MKGVRFMRIKFLPLLLMLCLLAVGCAETVDISNIPSEPSDISNHTSESDTSEPSEEPTWDVTPRELDYIKNGFSGEFRNLRMPTSSDSDTMTLVATSNEEMKEILAATERGMTYEEFIEKYGENFFDTKALILSDCTMPSISIVVELESVRIDESGITLSISTKTPTICLDATLSYIMTVEVNKSDIGGCKTAKTIIEEHVYPVSGKVGEYDETPRDIKFTPYTFNYRIKDRVIESIDGKPDLKVSVYGDLFFIFEPEFDELEEYGKSGTDIKQYFKKGNDYFEDKAIISTYIASSDGRSNFEISSLRADENGITMTVKHTLAEEAETDEVYSVVVAEVEKELLAGCELFNVVLDESEGALPSPYEFPVPPFEKNPYNEININNQTPEGYGTEITEEPEFIGSYYNPVYVYLTDKRLVLFSDSDPCMKLSGVELFLYDDEHNIVQRSITNSDGVARFVIPVGENYHIGFAGNNELHPRNAKDATDKNYCVFVQEDAGVKLSQRTEDGKVATIRFSLMRKSDFKYNPGEATVKFIDKTTKKPIKNVSVTHNSYLRSDENGIISAVFYLSKSYSVVADGYDNRDFKVTQEGKEHIVELTPSAEKTISNIEITVIDKTTKKPIKNATVLVGDYYGPGDLVERFTDENGKVTVTAKIYDIKHHSTQICVYIEDYYSYCLIYPDEGRDSYTVMLHKYLSEYK